MISKPLCSRVLKICYQMLPSRKRGSREVIDLLVDLIGIEPMTSSVPWKYQKPK